MLRSFGQGTASGAASRRWISGDEWPRGRVHRDCTSNKHGRRTTIPNRVRVRGKGLPTRGLGNRIRVFG